MTTLTRYVQTDRPVATAVCVMAPMLVAAVLYPVPFIAAVLFAGILFFGLRYPVATAGVVLVIIPVIDQAVADREFVDLFGAFRLTPAVVLKAMMSLVIGSYLIRNRVNPIRPRPLQPLLLWLAYTLLTCFTFHDVGLALSMWLRLAYWVAYFVFFFVVASERRSEHKVRRLWQAGLGAVAIFAGAVHLAKALGIGGEYYKVGESYGFYADPWNMAMTLPGGLVVALLYPWVFREKRTAVKLGCVLLAGVTVLASFFTMTRTSLIACLAATLIFTFALRMIVRSGATRAMFAVAVIAVALVGVVVYRNITSSARGNQVSARWSEVEKGDIASGRLEVFYAAWSKFLGASPGRKAIGHGIGAGPEAAEEFMGVYVYLHDDLLEMLVCAGLIGVALYSWSFARFYRDILIGFRRKNVWAVAALTGFAVYNITSLSYMRIYAVTPNTYFALVAGTSLGMLSAGRAERA